jgi:hypothetical protein
MRAQKKLSNAWVKFYSSNAGRKWALLEAMLASHRRDVFEHRTIQPLPVPERESVFVLGTKPSLNFRRRIFQLVVCRLLFTLLLLPQGFAHEVHHTPIRNLLKGSHFGDKYDISEQLAVEWIFHCCTVNR